jgi:hypothetical protein
MHCSLEAIACQVLSLPTMGFHFLQKLDIDRGSDIIIQ